MAYFFDSWGAIWAQCDADHDEAEAFGPSGVGRKLGPAEQSKLGLVPAGADKTAWAAAETQGRLAPCVDGGWTMLAEEV